MKNQCSLLEFELSGGFMRRGGRVHFLDNHPQEAVDFVWNTVRGVSNGHGFKVVHFCTTFVPMAYDFAECGANLHHMKRFRHFMLESGVFLHYIPNPTCLSIGSFIGGYIPNPPCSSICRFLIGYPQFIDSFL